MDSKYLAAFTPSDYEGYEFYPPFINVTRVGDKVRVMVRDRDYSEGEYNVCGSIATIDIPIENFKDLMLQILDRLED